jgi:hypothetical protein
MRKNPTVTRLTLGQAYILVVCAQPRPRGHESHVAGWINMFDGAPSGVTIVLDGELRHICDTKLASKTEANGLAKRGLLTQRGYGGGIYEVTEAGRRALSERQDLVRELLRLTEERKKWEAENWGD